MIKSGPAHQKTLGEILLARGLVSRAQLDLALRIKDVQPQRYLGEILCNLGVPQETILRTLYYSHKRRSIGEVLLDQEMISRDRLAEALARQKHIRETIGQAKPLALLLVDMGQINTREYLWVLSKHYNMPIVNLRDYSPSSLLQQLIGERYALENKIIVLEDSAEVVKFVLADPSIALVEELRRAFPPKKRVACYLASYTAVHECLQRLSNPLPFS